VIEQLAAGIPTIAYDVPGPRHIFAGLASTQFLVPAGDTKAMAERAMQILQMNENDYAALSVKCRQIADGFRWEKIAGDTIRDYRESLAHVTSPQGQQNATSV
jgi:glycosyltransferase involved in cell wall biosynthesis